MAGSLFSPQQITFTQKDFDFTFFHTQPLYVEAFVDHYQIKRILIESGASYLLSTARQLNLDPSCFAPHYSCLCI
jgi:hypothetical protein